MALTPHCFGPYEVLDIMYAANATNSDVIYGWYEPDDVMVRFLGTDYEKTAFVLPPTTEQSVANENIVSGAERCVPNANMQELAGEAKGARQTPREDLKHVVGTSLRQLAQRGVDGEIADPALWSPAGEVVANTEISNLQIDTIFALWYELDLVSGHTQRYYDLREACCQWVADNIDDIIQDFIPDSFPRTLVEENQDDVGILCTALVAISLVIFSALSTWKRQRKTSVYHGQIEVIFTVLLGLSVQALGAILLSLNPSELSCLSSAWFVNIGWAIAYVPLVLKVDAINRAVGTAKHMVRIRLTNMQLFRAILVMLYIVAIFLTAWTILDPYTIFLEYDLTNNLNSMGETVVLYYGTCQSGSSVWFAGSLAWQGCLLAYGFVLAMMAKRNKEDMNGADNLLALFLGEGCCLAVRVWLFVGRESVENETQDESLLISIGCIGFLAIFVCPKLYGRGGSTEDDDPPPDLFLHTVSPRSCCLNISLIPLYRLW